MVWYSHLLKNFPQFVVIHAVKGFGIVNKAEVDIFLELSCFFYDPMDVGNFISGIPAFSKSSLNIWKFLDSYHLAVFSGGGGTNEISMVSLIRVLIPSQGLHPHD